MDLGIKIDCYDVVIEPSDYWLWEIRLCRVMPTCWIHAQTY